MPGKGSIVGIATIVLLIIWSYISGQSGAIIFSVMGDVPRSNAEVAILDEQIAQHNDLSPARFVVHVGDIKDGKSPCVETVYANVAAQLLNLDAPLFIIPGDNEWNDCIDPSPEAAWAFWTQHFLGFEDHWSFKPTVYRQGQQLENFAFTTDGFAFIGLNLVGGRIFEQAVRDEKIRLDVQWIDEQLARPKLAGAVIFAQANPDTNHIDFINGLRSAARKFGRPILFVHGDGHLWFHEDPWLEDNLSRIQVDKGGIADPVLITIKRGDPITFEFEREPFKGVQ